MTLARAPAVRPWTPGDALDFAAPLVWTVEALFSPEECDAWIARIDAAGPVAAPITTASGFAMRPDVRNNTRVIFDDVPRAAALWERVRSEVPASLFGGMRAVGVNERFRCYRYEPGQRFAPHFDGSFIRDENELSLLTLIVYLNQGFAGGETRFLDLDVTIQPKVGTALLFQHQLLHEGCIVGSGVKYAARTDVMYRAPLSAAS